MASTYDHWLTVWVEQVYELLQRPMREFPYRTLFPLLVGTFGATPTWHEVSPDARFHMEMYEPPSGWPADEVSVGWEDVSWWDHPITRWYLVSHTVEPQSTERVPSSVLVPDGRRFVDELRPYGLHQQLVMPVTAIGPTNQSILLAQGERDYTDGQLALARALQPLLMLLDRHLAAQGTLSPTQTDQVAEWRLTGRETAVLRLLAQGLSAGAIATRLACSPRTVEKHVEHIYRKLGVRDRVSATRLAIEHNLHEPAVRPWPEEGTQPAPDDRIAVLDGRLRPFSPELLG